MSGIAVAPEAHTGEIADAVMRQGGNAADAAIAVAFAQGVLNPFHCGIGGTGTFLFKPARGPARLIDCSVTCGSGAVPDDWIADYRGRAEAFGRFIIGSEENGMGYRSIMTPGFVRGCRTIVEQFGSGSVTWADLLQPAIRLAVEGFRVDRSLALLWTDTDDRPGYVSLLTKLKHDAEAKRIYLKPGAQPYAAGDRLALPDYGRSLEQLAAEGDSFYTGDIGRQIAADLEANGSLVTGEDLTAYEVLEGQTVGGKFGKFDLTAAGGFASGTQVVEMLHILQGFDVQRLEHNSAPYIQLLAKIMRASFLDNRHLKGDPPYSIGAELTRRFTSHRWAERWQDVIRSGAGLEGPPAPTGLGSETTHLCAADGAGNFASFTHSLGSNAGAGVVTTGLGFLYNNYLGHFNPLPNQWDSIAPQKRGIGGAPVIVRKDGEPVLILGASGGSRLITAVFQVIVNVLVWNMSVAEAVRQPRFHSEERQVIFLERAFPAGLDQVLARGGMTVRRSDYMARVQAIAAGPPGAGLTPGADPRLPVTA
ncbi:MAG: gamma-glutamyltransferase [Thermaerobacterales bacterium]